jgi:Sec-independent protein translocase protein TatA
MPSIGPLELLVVGVIALIVHFVRGRGAGRPAA